MTLLHPTLSSTACALETCKVAVQSGLIDEVKNSESEEYALKIEFVFEIDVVS